MIVDAKVVLKMFINAPSKIDESVNDNNLQHT